MPDYEIIDAHMHVFPTREAAQLAGVFTGFCDYDGTPADALVALRQGGISRGVMVIQLPVAYMMEAALLKLPEETSEEERRRAESELRAKMIDRIQRRNVWVLEVAREHPELIPLITVDPIMGPELMKQEIIDKVSNYGARGVKLHPPIGRYYPHDRVMWSAYEACVDLDVPILFHCGPHPHFDGRSLVPQPVLYSRPSHFVDIVARFPELKIVLAHMGVGPDNRFPDLYPPLYKEAIAVAKQCPQLYFDTCAVVEPRWSPAPLEDWVAMIREIGAERVLFGSDYPAFDPARDVQWWQQSSLTAAEKRLIFAENARRVFKLG